HELGRVLPGGASISSIQGTVGSGSASTGSQAGAGSAGAGSATGTPKGATGGAGAAVSATPPGSVPTFALSGCATSQSEVALTLNRLRLIDGVSEVTLQTSTKASPGAAASVALGGCPAADPAYTIQLTFDPLPAASSIRAATIVPAAS